MDVISPPPVLGTQPKWISCVLNHSDSHFVCLIVCLCVDLCIFEWVYVYIVCVLLCMQLL